MVIDVNGRWFKEKVVVVGGMKNYLQPDWVRGVQYWPYLYSVLNI